MLQTIELSKHYGKGGTLVKAVDKVSLTIKDGEFVAIIGASGSGKSTLLHLLGGVDKPSNGKVIIDDEEIYKLSKDKLAKFRRRQVGIIYQFFNLLPTLTVKENISLPVLLDGRKMDKEKLSKIIKQLGLTGKEDALPCQLSGGQQQRVAIGRAIANNPSIIIADEPTGNLDSKSSNNIVELLKDLNEKYHQTIIMVTHDLGIAKTANRIIAFQDGKIVKDTRKRG